MTVLLKFFHIFVFSIFKKKNRTEFAHVKSFVANPYFKVFVHFLIFSYSSISCHIETYHKTLNHLQTQHEFVLLCPAYL